MLQVSRLMILRRAKRGSIPSFRVGFLCPLRFGCHRQVAYAAGRAVDVPSHCGEDPESEVTEAGQ